MMHLSTRRCPLVAAALLFAAAAPVLAQPPASELQFRFDAGASYQFDTDLDDGGEFSVTRVNGGIAVTYEFNPDLKLNADFGYEFSSYDFSGSVGFGGLNPWEDIHSIRLRANFTSRLDEQWSVFGGPILTMAAEDGADLGDGFAGGGSAGVIYHDSDTLSLGLGVVVISEIEDDIVIFPTFVVNWKVNDEWTVRNGMGGSGIEAAWTFAEDWELAFGAQYQWRQFKLDDGGVAPGGVGVDLSIPLYANLTWQFTPTASLDLMAALVVGGELELQNSSGNTITDQDSDPTAMLGVRVTITF